jgi:hypothetical protein
MQPRSPGNVALIAAGAGHALKSSLKFVVDDEFKDFLFKY